jgi:hypothetical protein
MQDKKRQLHHEEHEVNHGSAGRLTGFMTFAFGDQSRDSGTVGSRPAGRRWRVNGNNYLTPMAHSNNHHFSIAMGLRPANASA